MVTRINKIKTFIFIGRVDSTCGEAEIPSELAEFIKNREVVNISTTTYSVNTIGTLVTNYIIYTVVYSELVS